MHPIQVHFTLTVQENELGEIYYTACRGDDLQSDIKGYGCTIYSAIGNLCADIVFKEKTENKPQLLFKEYLETLPTNDLIIRSKLLGLDFNYYLSKQGDNGFLIEAIILRIESMETTILDLDCRKIFAGYHKGQERWVMDQHDIDFPAYVYDGRSLPYDELLHFIGQGRNVTLQEVDR